jgi:hypothetical protein
MLHVEFLHSSFLHLRGGWRQDGWCIAPGRGEELAQGQAEALRRRSATLGHNRHNRSKPRRGDGYAREAPRGPFLYLYHLVFSTFLQA